MRDNGRVQTLRDCHPFALLRASAYLVARNDNLAAGGAAQGIELTDSPGGKLLLALLPTETRETAHE